MKYDALQELTFFGQPLGDSGVGVLCDAIRCCHKLTKLALNDCKLTDRGLNQLSATLQTMNPAPPLDTLSLDYNRELGADGMFTVAKTLVVLPTMRSLSCSFCDTQEKGAENLARFIKSRFCRLEYDSALFCCLLCL